MISEKLYSNQSWMIENEFPKRKCIQRATEERQSKIKANKIRYKTGLKIKELELENIHSLKPINFYLR